MRVALITVMMVVVVGTTACDKKKVAGEKVATKDKTEETTKAPGPSPLDLPAFEAALKVRVAAMFERPSVSHAFDGFLTSVTSEPKVRDGFGTFLQQLEADPQVMQGTSAVLQRVQETKEMQDAVMTLMAQNPGATPDQIGEMVGKQFEQTWESPPVAAAWASSFNQLTRRLDTGGVLDPLEHAVSVKIDGYVANPKMIAHWEKRIAELNGGSQPDTGKAMQLYLDTAWSNERIEAFVQKLLANPTLRREAAVMLSKLLASEPLRKEATADCAAIMTDKTFQDAAVETMKLLTGTHPDGAKVEKALTKLLTSKPLVDSAGRLIKMLAEDPQLRAIFAEWMDHVSSDTALAADLDTFFNGW